MTPLLLIPLGIMGALLLCAACTVYNQYTYWKKRKTLHLELVPVLGHNYPIFFGLSSFVTHSLNLYKRHPKARYYGMFDFRKPAIVVKDLELIRDICIKNFDNFMDHEPFVTEEMDPIAGCNLFSLCGQKWKNSRRTLSPSYTAPRMKLLFDLMSECSHNFVRYFVENPEAAKDFQARDIFKRYANDVIATSAFGVEVNSLKDWNNEFYAYGQSATSVGKPLWILKIVLLLNFPRIMRLFGTTFFPKAADRFFKRLIEETIRTRKENGIIRLDMLQLLIDAMDNKTSDFDITMDNVVGHTLIFFIAGFETTSNLMSFLALELAANRDIQDKLYHEIDKQFGNDGKITYESLTELKYLDMVVTEALRKYPLASMTNRRCTKDCTLPPPMEGYPELQVEKDTVVMIPIYAIHHNPQYYPNPEKFDPDRFSETNKSKIQPYTYLPFGIGPRQCIGNRFALMETKIVIVHLLQKFVLKFSEKTQYPVEYSKRSFSLTAADGIWLNMEERKKNN